MLIYFLFLFCFFKKVQNFDLNLALKKELGKEFENLVDGIVLPYQSGKYSRIYSYQAPIIHLEGFFLLKKVVFFKGFYENNENSGKITVKSVSMEGNHQICGSFPIKIFKKKKFTLWCKENKISNKVIIFVEKEFVILSEIEIYGIFPKKNSAKIYFSHGCFENLKLKEKIEYYSLDDCFFNCQKNGYFFTAFNEKECGCLKSNLDMASFPYGSCSKICPYSQYICGNSDFNSYRILEERNLCLDPRINTCKSDFSYCKYLEGKIKCFCKNSNKEISTNPDDSECDIQSPFISYKTIIISEEFFYNFGPPVPKEIVFIIKSFEKSILFFYNQCENIDCSIFFRYENEVECAKKFSEIVNLEINELFLIKFFTNNSKNNNSCKIFINVSSPSESENVEIELTRIIEKHHTESKINEKESKSSFFSSTLLIYIGFGFIFTILFISIYFAFTPYSEEDTSIFEGTVIDQKVIVAYNTKK